MLEARNVSFRRCGRTLVRGVTLSARAGELLALSGPEGSGAATLLRVLAGRLTPDAGWVLIDGVAQSIAPLFVDRAPPFDGRLFASGPQDAMRALDDPGQATMVLLEHPTKGLGSQEAGIVMA